jgi:hypothetical protein
MKSRMTGANKMQKQNIGNAGEYYVAARLSAMDYTTTVTIGRSERYDIIAVSPEGKPYKFSVKSRFDQEATGFNLSPRDETSFTDDLFYVFVRLYEFKRQPDFWVVPSGVVSRAIATSHQKWLKDPGRDGKPHNDNPIRKIPVESRGWQEKYYGVGWTQEMQRYKNNFDALIGPPSRVAPEL